MKGPRKLWLSMFGLLGVLAIIAVVVLATGVDLGSIGGGTLVECTGEIEVDFLGVGTPELDPAPVCSSSKSCTLVASVFDPFLPDVEEGSVVMVIDGKRVDSFDWSSEVGENIPFTVRDCQSGEFSSVDLELRDEAGSKIDWCSSDGGGVCLR